MTDTSDDPAKSPLRQRADEIRPFRCRHVIAVIERPTDIKKVASVIRNANAPGVGIVLYEVTKQRRAYQSRFRRRNPKGAREVSLPTVMPPQAGFRGRDR